MHTSFRPIWNESSRTWVAASETADCHVQRAVLPLASAVLLALASSATLALPAGGTVSAGQAGIASSGNLMTVNQQSQNLAIDWRNFGIDASESLRFVQPNASAIVLNRVLGPDPSRIQGQLSANGQVWLLNPNGILFGSTAQVNVGGLVASTLNISDADFLAGRRVFSGSGGTILNQGSIATADGGYVALLGGRVSNDGVIRARLGTVALAAGSRVSLDFAGDQLLSLQVDQGAVNALAQNKQLIQADGGNVLLSARAADTLLSTVVNNSGVIEARSIDAGSGAISGTIRLSADKQAGIAEVGGTLDASAPNGGNGGLIETSGAQVKLQPGLLVTTDAPLGTTGTLLIDPNDYNIAASGGDITGAALASQLNTSNVSILSSNGVNAGAGDINVNDAVAWNSPNSLTLSALHSVNLSQPITNAGSGGITLRADNAGACVAGASGCGTVNFSGAGHLTVNGGAVNLYVNPLGSNNAADANGKGPSYATPTDYSGRVTLNGTSTLNTWLLVNDANQLQAMNTNLGAKYALGRDIDATPTSGWNPSTDTGEPNAGFLPVGNAATPFTGILDGQAHTIANLTITGRLSDDPNLADLGLFGYTSGTLRNVGLTHANVTGLRVNRYVGTLAGYNLGTIDNAYATGNVNATRTVGGGLVGYNAGTIAGSYATSGVFGLNGAGGLAAYNAGTIRDAHALGNVNSQEDGSFSGGLVGYNTGTIDRAYSAGRVISYSDAGGLVGRNLSIVSNAYATGSVLAYRGPGGGLAAFNSGSITNAYATGEVTGSRANNGGLVGINNGALSQVFATGSVVGNSAAGDTVNNAGLVGSNAGSIDNAYATGNVSGSTLGTASNNAGLVADNSGSISHTYATGHVSGATNNGGLIARNSGPVADSYWDATTSGLSVSAAGTGLTDAQMKQQASFAGFDFNNVWRIYEDRSYPLLRAFLKPLTISADNVSKVYDGQPWAGPLQNPRFSDPTAATSPHLYGLAAPYDATKNAGTYYPTLWSDQFGYDISYLSGTLTITPATLTYFADHASMRQGSPVPSLSGTVRGFVAGETIDNATTGTLTWVTNATPNSAVGPYSVHGQGLVANYGNYVFVQSPRNDVALTVNRGNGR